MAAIILKPILKKVLGETIENKFGREVSIPDSFDPPVLLGSFASPIVTQGYLELSLG